MRIGYAIVDCSLGRLLVAATGQGISHISMGDSDAPLQQALRADYPNTEIYRDDTASGQWADVILNYLAGNHTDLNLPLDVRATDFQRRVWDELRAIPYGHTRTYGEIARALGYPTAAARAVGRACATNPASLVIPCHRALREGGGLGGYRWGLARKRSLLDLERAVQPAPTSGTGLLFV